MEWFWSLLTDRTLFSEEKASLQKDLQLQAGECSYKTFKIYIRYSLFCYIYFRTWLQFQNINIDLGNVTL